jgi:hypothetical protein
MIVRFHIYKGNGFHMNEWYVDYQRRRVPTSWQLPVNSTGMKRSVRPRPFLPVNVPIRALCQIVEAVRLPVTLCNCTSRSLCTCLVQRILLCTTLRTPRKVDCVSLTLLSNVNFLYLKGCMTTKLIILLPFWFHLVSLDPVVTGSAVNRMCIWLLTVTAG